MKNCIIAVLVAVIAIGGSVSVFAATQTVETTASVEVRVWQAVSNGSLYLSTRPAEGTWTTHNTALDMSELHPAGNFYQSSVVTVDVPVTVEVEVPDLAPPVDEEEPESTPVPEQEGTLVGWVHSSEQDLGDLDFPGGIYSLEGYSTDDYSWEPSPTIALHCYSAEPGFSFFTNALLFNDYDSDRISVYWKVLSGEEDLVGEFQQWRSNEKSDSLVTPDDPTGIVSFLRETGSGLVYIGAIDWIDTQYSIILKIDGVRDVLDALPCYQDESSG